MSSMREVPVRLHQSVTVLYHLFIRKLMQQQRTKKLVRKECETSVNLILQIQLTDSPLTPFFSLAKLNKSDGDIAPAPVLRTFGKVNTRANKAKLTNIKAPRKELAPVETGRWYGGTVKCTKFLPFILLTFLTFFFTS